MASIVFKGIRQITTSEYESLVQTNPTAVAGTLFFVRDSVTDEIGKIYFGTRCYSSNNYYTKEELDDAHYVISSSLNDLNSRIGTISGSTDTNEYVIAEALTDLDSRVSDIEDGYLANAGGGASSFNDLTDLPTTLDGYGITDAYISGNYIYLGNNSLYVPTSITGNYLPLSGGTMTGNILANTTAYTLGSSSKPFGSIYMKGGQAYLSGTTNTQAIQPLSHGSYAIGTNNKRYTYLYLTQSVYATGGTSQFNAVTLSGYLQTCHIGVDRTNYYKIGDSSDYYSEIHARAYYSYGSIISQTIYPSTTKSYDIGTTSAAYKELYLQGSSDSSATAVLSTLKNLQSSIGDIETILASI